MLALLLLGAAEAAEVTEMPPALRGDLGLRHDTFVRYDRLQEDGDLVGRRRQSLTDLSIRGEFSFMTGAGLFFDAPRYGERVRFPEANQMVFDPLADSGTMRDTAALDGEVLRQGAGFGGTWLGLVGAPVHEQLFAARGDRSSWRIEAAYRFADKTSFWTYDTARQRFGAGPGAGAFRLGTAFSTTHRSAQPYITADLVRSSRLTADVVDENGQTLIRDAAIQPASSAEVTTGAELFVWRDPETKSHVSLDFRASFGYQSAQTIPSGVYLPSVLDASRTVLIEQAEQTSLDLGFGVNSRITDYASLNVGGEIGTISPQQVEHLYSVYTAPGTLTWQLHVAATFRARDPLVKDIFTPHTEPGGVRRTKTASVGTP